MTKRKPFEKLVENKLQATNQSSASSPSSTATQGSRQSRVPVLDDRDYAFLGEGKNVAAETLSQSFVSNRRDVRTVPPGPVTSQTKTPRISNVSLAAAEQAAKLAALKNAKQSAAANVTIRRRASNIKFDDESSTDSDSSQSSRRRGKRRRRAPAPEKPKVESQKPPLPPKRPTSRPRFTSLSTTAASLRTNANKPQDSLAQEPPRRRATSLPTNLGSKAGEIKPKARAKSTPNPSEPVENIASIYPNEMDNDDMDLASDEELVISPVQEEKDKPDLAAVKTPTPTLPSPKTLSNTKPSLPTKIDLPSQKVAPDPPSKKASLRQVVLGKPGRTPPIPSRARSAEKANAAPSIPSVLERMGSTSMPPASPLPRGGVISDADLLKYRQSPPDNAQVLQAMLAGPARKSRRNEADEEEDEDEFEVRSPVKIETVELARAKETSETLADDDVSELTLTSVDDTHKTLEKSPERKRQQTAKPTVNSHAAKVPSSKCRTDKVKSPKRRASNARQVQPSKRAKDPLISPHDYHEQTDKAIKSLQASNRGESNQRQVVSVGIPKASVRVEPKKNSPPDPKNGPRRSQQKPHSVNKATIPDNLAKRSVTVRGSAKCRRELHEMSRSAPTQNAVAKQNESGKPSSGKVSRREQSSSETQEHLVVDEGGSKGSRLDKQNGETQEEVLPESRHDTAQPSTFAPRNNSHQVSNPLISSEQDSTEKSIEASTSTEKPIKEVPSTHKELSPPLEQPNGSVGVMSPDNAENYVETQKSTDQREAGTLTEEANEERDKDRADSTHPFDVLEHRAYTAERAGFRHMAPFIRFPNGETYLHPPLPPGWQVSMCQRTERPYYWHPDFGRTYFPPMQLPSASGLVHGFTPPFVVTGRGRIPPPDGNDLKFNFWYEADDEQEQTSSGHNEGRGNRNSTVSEEVLNQNSEAGVSADANENEDVESNGLQPRADHPSIQSVSEHEGTSSLNELPPDGGVDMERGSPGDKSEIVLSHASKRSPGVLESAEAAAAVANELLSSSSADDEHNNVETVETPRPIANSHVDGSTPLPSRDDDEPSFPGQDDSPPPYDGGYCSPLPNEDTPGNTGNEQPYFVSVPRRKPGTGAVDDLQDDISLLGDGGDGMSSVEQATSRASSLSRRGGSVAGSSVVSRISYRARFPPAPFCCLQNVHALEVYKSTSKKRSKPSNNSKKEKRKKQKRQSARAESLLNL